MSALRDLLVCFSLHSTLSLAQSEEILGYKTTLNIDNVSSITDASLQQLKTALASEGALIKSLSKDVDTNTIVLQYDDAATERALENLLDSETANEVLKEALSLDTNFDPDDYSSEAELELQEQVTFTVVGVPETVSKYLPTQLGKDIAALTTEQPKDVKVFQLPPKTLLAYARMAHETVGAGGTFHQMSTELENANESLDGSWMTYTANALDVSAREFSIETMSVEEFPTARGYIEFSYSADPKAASISQLLTGAKRVEDDPVETLEFAIFDDMRYALGLPFATGDTQIPFSQIIRLKDEGFIMSYDVEDPMMWAMSKLVADPKKLVLTNALSYLTDVLRLTESPKLEIVSMEQQDVSGAGYALISATFVGAGSDIMEDENELHTMEYALRNDIMKTFGLQKADLFDIYIDREESRQANGSFILVIVPDSEESYTHLSQMMKDKEQDNSWLVEARAHEPGLLLKESDVGAIENRNDVGTTIEDDTCRVGGLHCDHIKGIVALLVLTIVISAVGYYFVIYRPSKKRQQDDVQAIPANHTFVFSRSLGASTHRSAASSFYGGTRRVPRPGQNEEVDMGEVQYQDENSQRAGMHAGTHDMYHTSNQHPAAYV